MPPPIRWKNTFIRVQFKSQFPVSFLKFLRSSIFVHLQQSVVAGGVAFLGPAPSTRHISPRHSAREAPEGKAAAKHSQTQELKDRISANSVKP